MLYIVSTLLAILFYALLLVPVFILVIALHLVVLKRLSSYKLQRALLFPLLLVLITPLRLASGNGAFFDMPIPRPLYTFYIDILYSGGSDVLTMAVTMNPLFSMAGLSVSVFVCAFLAMRAYK